MPPLLPLEPEPEPEPVALGGEVGVKVADGFVRHELAATFALEMLGGAFALTVAFPEKSHEVALRLVSS